jgi:hypothetical protein
MEDHLLAPLGVKIISRRIYYGSRLGQVGIVHIPAAMSSLYASQPPPPAVALAVVVVLH